MINHSRIRTLILLSLGLGFGSGCAVPQPRGQGLYQYLQEPTTKAWYHIYLPVDYVKNNGRHPDPKIKRWPLVMTFHGMKPYDNALPQEREWEQQADIYGYVVCAPELRTSDSFMEYPLTQEHSYVLEDKRNVIAIMDHVCSTTLADPKRVLSTSWSCGGYLAHYFPNRFPDRFSCIATRLSNFSSSLMREETTALYRNRVPISIFIGDGDFPACKTESEEAVAWYVARGFKVVRGKMIDNMGHSRIPQTAAAFFAEQLGIEPLRPVEAAATVALVQMTEYHPPQEMIARVSPPVRTDLTRTAIAGRDTQASSLAVTTPPVVPPTRVAQGRTVTFENGSAGKRYPIGTAPAYDPVPRQEKTKPSEPRPAEKPAVSQPPAETRLASADQRGNWLNPSRPAGEDRRNETTPRNDNANHPTERKSVAAKPAEAKPQATPQRTPTPPPSTKVSESSPTRSVMADAKPTPRTAAKPSPPPRPRTSGRSFTPSDAGPRIYGDQYASMSDSPATAANYQIARNRGRGPTDVPKTRTETVPATAAGAAQQKLRQEAARRVNIRLSGPAIGTSPHYLAYSVDLPRDTALGADFLWMDNGVWIGDEARGVKILESPGLHRISVLVVTRDNVEFRGSATVQVLDRGPTAAAY